MSGVCISVKVANGLYIGIKCGLTLDGVQYFRSLTNSRRRRRKSPPYDSHWQETTLSLLEGLSNPFTEVLHGARKTRTGCIYIPNADPTTSHARNAAVIRIKIEVIYGHIMSFGDRRKFVS
jgi:hypothetical protein